MANKTQIFTSTTYKVLDNMAEMEGKTVKAVIELADGSIAFINTNTILAIDSNNGDVIPLENFYDHDFKILEEETGITKDQLL